MDKPWQRQPTTPASPAARQNSCPQHRHRLPVPWDAGNVLSMTRGWGRSSTSSSLSSLGGSQQLPELPTFPPIAQPAVKPLLGDVLALLCSQELLTQ